ncbi:MAG: exosortase system-associated protein, TIGR04073 family [Omnitrophica bacterium]|nr:exosortase system-associated protein, TIGR04073 family [Candidatus Omnitrophota bacterium]
MVKVVAITVVACFVVLAFTSACFAGSGEPGPVNKLGKGINNLLTGWLELPRQITISSKEEGVKGLPYGFINGLANMIVRTVAGAIDTALFIVPPFDKPLMEPFLEF